MYLDKVRLQNVKCFADVTLQLTHAPELDPEHLDRQKNWNVILGENGEGKSTLLRAIATCLMDRGTAFKKLDLAAWIRNGASRTTWSADLLRSRNDLVVSDDKSSRKKKYRVERAASSNESRADGYDGLPSLEIEDVAPSSDVEFLNRNAFARGDHRGWLACGYGAFRRLPMPGRSYEASTDSMEAKFATLFDDNAALVKCEEWLKELDRLALIAGGDAAARSRLEQVKARICNLLPDVTNIEIAEDVVFYFKSGTRFSLRQLSDGYRSMFALIVDILRWLERAHPGTNVQVDKLSGVVLIDEVDAHLHPRWQREVGFKLTEQFPNLQFIVTTHSPFVAMAAGEGSLSVLRQDGDATRVDQDVPNPRGWLVDRVLDEVFHLDSLRDPETEKHLKRYQTLRFARGAKRLSPGESEELAELEVKLAKVEPHSSPSGSFALDQDLDLLTEKLKARRLGT